MGDIVGKVLDWVKSPRQMGIVLLACVIFLFLPLSFKQTFKLQDIDGYRGWIAATAILSFSVLLVELGHTAWKQRQTKNLKAANQQQRQDYLNDLSAEEKSLLLNYVRGSSDTQYLLMNDGNVGALQRKKILYRGANTGQMTVSGPMVAMNIYPWAKAYLKEHPYLLDNAVPSSGPPSVFDLI